MVTDQIFSTTDFIFSTDFDLHLLTTNVHFSFATTNNNQLNQRAIIDKHPISILLITMASTHTQVLLEEIKNGNAFKIGGPFVVAFHDEKATLLSNNSNVQHPNDHYNQLLSNALTTS